jgi:hypothetical protein
VGDERIAAAAAALLARAHGMQPGVRAALEAVAAQVGAELVGLEYEFKTRESLERKIAKERTYSLHEDESGQLEDAMRVIMDTLRYTMRLPSDRYVEGTDRALHMLADSGYRLRIRNTWVAGAPYMGINVAVRAANGFIFELQFHTPASLAAKEVTHPVYEQERTTLDNEERQQLQRRVVEVWATVAIPPGVEAIATERYSQSG